MPLRCRNCRRESTFHVEEMFNTYGLLEGVLVICANCGDVMVLPLRKENEIRQKIREKQNDKCFTCGKENPHTIHHRDSDPKNNSEDNLILLCGSCHKSIHRVRNSLRGATPKLKREIFRYLRLSGVELGLIEKASLEQES
jgi:hypothetical protein